MSVEKSLEGIHWAGIWFLPRFLAESYFSVCLRDPLTLLLLRSTLTIIISDVGAIVDWDIFRE